MRRDACVLPRREYQRLAAGPIRARASSGTRDAAAEAARQLVRNNVDYLPIDEIEGRIAATLFVVYPPGIATIVPGERLGPQARPMVAYLKAFERSSNLFPGFETEVQGVYREADATGKVRFYTYVVRE